MQVALIFVLLLTFLFGLGLLAQRLSVPYPILFVLGGLGISFMPGLSSEFRLEPDLVFFLILPPLLYIQAFRTSWRDFRFHLRSILLLAIGLVVATTVSVAYVAHWLIPHFPLSVGLVLGAIISPPDAIAASAIAQRLCLPRRVVTILEGESLVNDATSLVIFSLALGAAGATATSIRHLWIPVQFLYVSGGGIAVGLVVGWIICWIRRRTQNDDPKIALTISLLTPFVSYLLAGPFLQVSGVLAVVATGLYLGWRAPEFLLSDTRLQLNVVWDMIVYLLNGIVFVLIGLQLPWILHGLSLHSWPALLLYSAAINAVCIVVRLLWIFPGAYLPRLIRRIRQREQLPDWRQVVVAGWAGMRGIVSLAAALALSGYPGFPQAHLVQLLAFSVILVTLVFQGLTLPPLIRFLGVADDGIPAREETQAREHISEAALARIGELRNEEDFPVSAIEAVETLYRERKLAYQDDLAEQIGWSASRHHLLSVRTLNRQLVTAQRTALLHLRREGTIGDDVMHKIEHELDLEEARLT